MFFLYLVLKVSGTFLTFWGAIFRCFALTFPHFTLSKRFKKALAERLGFHPGKVACGPCKVARGDSLQICPCPQMRELKLDSWRDLEDYLEPVERVQNRELLALIRSLPTKWEVCRNELKPVCAPVSRMIRRARGAAGAGVPLRCLSPPPNAAPKKCTLGPFFSGKNIEK